MKDPGRANPTGAGNLIRRVGRLAAFYYRSITAARRVASLLALAQNLGSGADLHWNLAELHLLPDGTRSIQGEPFELG
jgi:hypothetical protein